MHCIVHIFYSNNLAGVVDWVHCGDLYGEGPSFRTLSHSITERPDVAFTLVGDFYTRDFSLDRIMPNFQTVEEDTGVKHYVSPSPRAD